MPLEHNGYLWPTVFRKSEFFSALMCCCREAAGVYGEDIGLDGPTLRAAAGERVCFRRGSVCTLVSAASFDCCCCGIVSTILSCVAKVKIALQTESPASNVVVVLEGVSVRIVVISCASCHRKSSSLTLGKGTNFGKKVTVLQYLTVFVRGK